MITVPLEVRVHYKLIMSKSLRNGMLLYWNPSLGKWLDDEQERFLKAMELFPKNWDKITSYVFLKIIFYYRLELEQNNKFRIMPRSIRST